MKRPVTYLFSLALALGLILLPAAAYAACPAAYSHDTSEQCGSRGTSAYLSNRACPSYGCDTYAAGAANCGKSNCAAADKNCAGKKTADNYYGFFSKSLCPNGSCGDIFSLLRDYGRNYSAPQYGEDAAPAGETAYDEYSLAVIDLVNSRRAAAGLGQLVLDEGLMTAAAIRAEEIQRTFAHTRPDGTSCFTVLEESGASYRAAGENIALGQKGPEQVMTAWMNSEGHRANILGGNYGRIGVAAIPNASGSGYAWVQLFAD